MDGLGVGRDGIGMFMYIRRGDISWGTNVMVFDYSFSSLFFFSLLFLLSRGVERLGAVK